ncbi:MAG: site-specific integrase [Oscillospiraceae bacterium]|nr:site-specific integrase [Oscillospiraceae bacterium]
MKKKNFNITQTDSGSYVTWVSEGCGHHRKKAKITGNTPEEVIVKAQKWLNHRAEEARIPYTVKEAMLDFIDSRSKVLEPTTLCNYREITRNRLQYIMDIKIEELTAKDIQMAINMEARRLSHKSIKNAYGFLRAVLNANDITLRLSSIRLPKKEVKERKLPTADEVYRIVKGTESELPVLLAMWLSLRIGEVAGLQFRDVDTVHHCIYIRREIVKADEGWAEVDHCKTEKSVRSVNLPPHICKLIETIPHQKDTDRILNVTPNTIRKRFKKLLRANGIEDIRFHDCRHIFASTAAMLNVPEKYAMEMGDWSTPDVYRNVYQETFDSR